ncbi:hypothetical protein KP509_07G019800 [Ceratopteris richardii]|uniref:Uncharacterized protein n=1 Tax=Ceratopteris richardii TaxID=49495 RepID=A0A8T2UJ52_CERRI|nr:hypothetical protein KP509_07G019800 [Ceratopteris richardii]
MRPGAKGVRKDFFGECRFRGLDFELHRCAQPTDEKIGVVDSQYIVHKTSACLGIRESMCLDCCEDSMVFQKTIEANSFLLGELSEYLIHELFNEEWGIAINHGNALHLVDYIYHEFREIMIPVLLDNKEAQDWEFSSFEKCFCFALQVSGDINSFLFKRLQLWHL